MKTSSVALSIVFINQKISNSIRRFFELSRKLPALIGSPKPSTFQSVGSINRAFATGCRRREDGYAEVIGSRCGNVSHHSRARLMNRHPIALISISDYHTRSQANGAKSESNNLKTGVVADV
jgi:hypothetical protein